MPDRRILDLTDCPDLNQQIHLLYLGLVAAETTQQVILPELCDMARIVYRATPEEDCRVQRLKRILSHRIKKGVQLLIAHEIEFFRLYKEEVLGIVKDCQQVEAA